MLIKNFSNVSLANIINIIAINVSLITIFLCYYKKMVSIFKVNNSIISNHIIELLLGHLLTNCIIIEYLVMATWIWLPLQHNDWGKFLIAFHYLENFYSRYIIHFNYNTPTSDIHEHQHRQWHWWRWPNNWHLAPLHLVIQNFQHLLVLDLSSLPGRHFPRSGQFLQHLDVFIPLQSK